MLIYSISNEDSMIKGFDAEFTDLPDYIRVITDRIWEGRRIEDINKYYSSTCAVETPSNVSVGAQAVIDGTIATLAAFPDRRLLAEDIIVSGDVEGGFLSSHRIFSVMTHAGQGVFGLPSNQPVHARTIADCVCINNQIVHEWLVRDQAAIARHIGSNERDMAQAWIDRQGGFTKTTMPKAPAPYVSTVDRQGEAQGVAQLLEQVFQYPKNSSLERFYAQDLISALPGGETAVGVHQIESFWRSVSSAIEVESFQIEHLVMNPRPGRSTAVAARWRVKGLHHFDGRYGQASGKHLEILAISHFEIQNGLIHLEWHLIDDVAVWMQVLDPKT